MENYFFLKNYQQLPITCYQVRFMLIIILSNYQSCPLPLSQIVDHCYCVLRMEDKAVCSVCYVLLVPSDLILNRNGLPQTSVPGLISSIFAPQHLVNHHTGLWNLCFKANFRFFHFPILRFSCGLCFFPIPFLPFFFNIQNRSSSSMYLEPNREAL